MEGANRKRMKLSVCIPVKNEESEIVDLISNLSFADEVVIIDTGSTDRTAELAKECGAKVYKKTFSNFADIRNFADEKARCEWILSMDADMRVTEKLKEEIFRIIESEKKAVKIGRDNIIWGGVVYHTDWSSLDDFHIRLYPANSGKWVGEVHEQYITSLKTIKTRGTFLHFNYNSVEEFMTKMDRYSQIESTMMINKDIKPVKLVIQAILEFSRRYFYKLGFLDGRKGLALSYMQGIYKIIVGIKRYELIQNK